jgi:hypothetical protein
MKSMLRTALLPAAILIAALLVARSCSGPPPAIPDPVELQRITAERVAVAVKAEREVAGKEREAARLREMGLYARIEALTAVPTPVPKPRRIGAKVAEPLTTPPITSLVENDRCAVSGQARRSPPHSPAIATEPTTDPCLVAASDPDRCAPLSPGWARCPESVLSRLTLRLVDETQRADVAEIRLDEERAYRRLDAEGWAVERAALAGRKPAPAWKVPAGIVGGAALATGVALAVAGSEEAGAVVGTVGLGLGIVAVW